MSKKTSLILLAVTALILSRGMFFLINDPEGPNLLIVTVAAILVYAVSLVAYVFNLSSSKKLLLGVLIQILVVGSFYFLN